MSATKGYVLVEGHGEAGGAAHNLVARLAPEVGCHLPWAPPRRWPNLHQWISRSGRGGVKAGAEFVRNKRDAAALLVLRDEDDACPREVAPLMAERLLSLQLPFPVAYVLLHPEYEVLFLPCLGRMERFKDVTWDGDSWEARRGIKEWLSSQLPHRRSYKPTVNQLPMTRRIDFAMLREADVPCFGSLERALAFLGEHGGQSGAVYPST